MTISYSSSLGEYSKALGLYIGLETFCSYRGLIQSSAKPMYIIKQVVTYINWHVLYLQSIFFNSCFKKIIIIYTLWTNLVALFKG